MRILRLLLLIPLIAACSTMAPPPSPSASVVGPSGTDIAGRWRGSWTGTGIFYSAREDDVTVDLVQQGDLGRGRLVLEGTIAAESVPQVVRFQGLNGIQVVAQIRPGAVTLRHADDGRLFTADLKVADDGQRMVGFVRGTQPAVGLVLTRAEGRPATPPETAPRPAPVQSQQEPAPMVVAAVPTPEPEAVEPRAERPRQEEFVAVQELPAVHFDFDKATIRSDAADTLVGYAGWLKDHADTALLIEGHCDERGTAEYNVALGDRRARAVKDYLATYGVAPDRVSTVSYGKERPACTATTEACHEQNRRAEFRVKTR